MKTALVCTSVTVPSVLELYRQHVPYAKKFVACDLNTPGEIFHFCQKIGAICLTPNDQKQWKSSELFGWNCIQSSCCDCSWELRPFGIRSYDRTDQTTFCIRVSRRGRHRRPAQKMDVVQLGSDCLLPRTGTGLDGPALRRTCRRSVRFDDCSKNHA